MKSASDKALEGSTIIWPTATLCGGLVLLYLLNDWHGSEVEFHRALELNPEESAAHDYYATAFLLHAWGACRNSIAESQRAVELDPLSPSTSLAIWAPFTTTRENTRSQKLNFAGSCRWTPNLPSAKWALMKLYEQQQRWPEASAQFQEVLAGVNNEPVLSVNADAHTVLSPQKQKYWSARIKMQQAIVKDIADYCDLAIAYARAGEKEKALDTLELAATKNNAALKDLNIEPAYDSIRNETEISAACRKK